MIGNLAHLGDQKGAVRDQPPPIARGAIVKAPTTINDHMLVALTGYVQAFPFEVPAGHWVQRGSTLPALGAVCAVAFDDKGDPWLLGYEGTVTP